MRLPLDNKTSKCSCIFFVNIIIQRAHRQPPLWTQLSKHSQDGWNETVDESLGLYTRGLAVFVFKSVFTPLSAYFVTSHHTAHYNTQTSDDPDNRQKQPPMLLSVTHKYSTPHPSSVSPTNQITWYALTAESDKKDTRSLYLWTLETRFWLRACMRDVLILIDKVEHNCTVAYSCSQ